jgi:hypothetical protein
VTRNPDLWRRQDEPEPVRLSTLQVGIDEGDVGLSTVRLAVVLCRRLEGENVRPTGALNAALTTLSEAIDGFLDDHPEG